MGLAGGYWSPKILGVSSMGWPSHLSRSGPLHCARLDQWWPNSRQGREMNISFDIFTLECPRASGLTAS